MPKPLLAAAPFLLLLAACGEPATVVNGPDEAQPSAADENILPALEAPPPEPTAQSTIPASFHGRYDASPDACGETASEMRLRISGGELRFYESVAEVREVRVHGPRHIEVDADHLGEGERWTATRTFRLGEGNATLEASEPPADGGEPMPVTRVRC